MFCTAINMPRLKRDYLIEDGGVKERLITRLKSSIVLARQYELSAV
jgi:hypothetical protein